MTVEPSYGQAPSAFPAEPLQQDSMLRWVSVTTVLAPAWFIRLHSAYLKLLGADQCVYFMDQPAAYTEAELAELAQDATLILCDPAYWKSVGGRSDSLPGRQLKNVQYARAHVDARWFLHIDIDEFPFFRGDIGRMLDGVPDELSELRFQNVERLLVQGDSHWHEGVFRLPNFDRELQARHYGHRTRFLAAGLACYFHGKSLVRNGPYYVQGVHGGLHKRPERELVRMTVPLHEGFMAHYPCICPQHFSYRLRRNKFSVPNVRKFRHEHRLDNFMFGPGARPEHIDHAVVGLHTCTRNEAMAWSEAGLCRAMPEAYLRRLEQAAGASGYLDMDFAERSFAEFYQRLDAASAPTAPTETAA